MRRFLPHWVWLSPLLGWLLLGWKAAGVAPAAALAIGVILSVLAAVHHAELVAHRVGEPFGTLLLAIAVTVIEVGLIVSLTAQGGAGASTLARDTVFAAVMIILNGLLGLCILIGAILSRAVHRVPD